MNWSNWVTHATTVLDFFIYVAKAIFDLILASPVTGVPVIVIILGLILSQVVKFMGAFGTGKNSSED